MTNLFQNATNQIKSLLTNQCSISTKPSTMDDTNDCLMTTNPTLKTTNLFRIEPDLSEDERFRACFIDCSCDCSAKKLTQGRLSSTTDLGIFEQFLQSTQRNNYQISCDCQCGNAQQRSFSFNYSFGRIN